MTPRNDFSPAGMLLKSVVAAAGALVAAYLLWKLRSLTVPVAVSSLMAYICRPLVTRLERHRVPRGLGIWLLLFVFVLAALFIANRVRSIVPTEIEALDLKVRAIYKINEGYKNLMGLDQSLTRGNWIYQLAHDELDPIVDQINRLLTLTPEEHTQFLASHPLGPEAPAGSDRLLDYYRVNLQTLKVREPAALPQTGAVRAAPPPVAQTPTLAVKTPIATLGHILSTWIIAPLIFLFLLRDTGEIKRGLLRAVPNRLFEPALMVLADLDHALGDYMRGMFLECALLGLTVTLLLPFVGVSLQWAIAIGIFTGATNVIPYLGSAVALTGGLTYALLAEEIHPLLPMVNTENIAIWIIAAVGLAELLKNVYEPLILGGAVKLHPLVVVIGVVGGGILFDLAGVLLAIPMITIFKVFVSSTARQLKAYGLI